MASKEILYYQTSDGKTPYEEWFKNLKDIKGKTIIAARLDRFEAGNPGKYRTVGGGVYELKIYFGPGYRIYFGEDGKTLIILLCGGDKSVQSKDIEKAQKYWNDYLRRKT